MVISYTFKNFKTFKEENTFSFLGGRKKELEEHLMSFDEHHRVLPLKVIYGSNASGKTNIIKSLFVLKRIVLETKLKEAGEQNYLMLCSNFSSLEDYEAPVTFHLVFTMENDIYDYFLSIQNNYNDRKTIVLKEVLKENDALIFERNGNNVKFSTKDDVVKKHYPQFKDSHFKSQIMQMIKVNMDENSVFTGWYNFIDAELCFKLLYYFKSKLIVIYDLEDYKLQLPENVKEGIFSNKLIDALLHELETGEKEFYVQVDKSGKSSERVVYKIDENCKIEALPSSTESKGTIKMIDTLDLFLYALGQGATLVIDELDASIHHEIIYNIIQAFGDPSINKERGQLIFTTHNPVYMNKELLRRDEIVFVEKDNDSSIISTLEESNLRNDEVYLKNYLAGKYTILPKFDIEHLLHVDNKED